MFSRNVGIFQEVLIALHLPKTERYCLNVHHLSILNKQKSRLEVVQKGAVRAISTFWHTHTTYNARRGCLLDILLCFLRRRKNPPAATISYVTKRQMCHVHPRLPTRLTYKSNRQCSQSSPFGNHVPSNLSRLAGGFVAYFRCACSRLRHPLVCCLAAQAFRSMRRRQTRACECHYETLNISITQSNWLWHYDMSVPQTKSNYEWSEVLAKVMKTYVLWD